MMGVQLALLASGVSVSTRFNAVVLPIAWRIWICVFFPVFASARMEYVPLMVKGCLTRYIVPFGLCMAGAYHLGGFLVLN